MSSEHPVYLATVGLDRNRWGSREPSFAVSEWLSRWQEDGFDGVELWEYHYCDVEDSEREQLVDGAYMIPLYNTYTGFSDSEEDTAGRASAVAAVEALRATGIKYNLGRDESLMETYRRNLLAWSEAMPDTCRLLCECHAGTVLEELETATAFFADLDPDRFGVIAHLNGDAEGLDRWFEAWGDRLAHLHLQHRNGSPAPSTPEGAERMTACVQVLKDHGFDGSAAIEFTRGIGPDEQIKTLYANTVNDMNAYREAWA
ncbi:MAG: TIM barrel protein [Phycisphaeraceae bacterium]|nr:TIM barrel protein [Phycisphaeraceae bacterium]